MVPVANRLMRWRDMLPHQRSIALWVPSPRSLKRVLREHGFGGLKVGYKQGIHFVSFGVGRQIKGVGIGLPEALLSSLNDLRKKGY